MEERGLFLALPTLFALGLALNLTPCVYPMIPVTMGYFSRQGGGANGESLRSGADVSGRHRRHLFIRRKISRSSNAGGPLAALLGMALYFLAPLLPESIVAWMVFALAVVSGVYLGWLHNSSSGKAFYWLRKATGLSIFPIGLVAIIPRTSQVAVDWRSYDTGILDRARQEGERIME